MSDIIDRIDALVAEQLANYPNRSGYDNDVNQEDCGHCGRDWHGLARGHCPGSTFVGPLLPVEYPGGGGGERFATGGFVTPRTPRYQSRPWVELLQRQVIEFAVLSGAIDALGGTWNEQWTIEEARAERDRLVAGHTAEMTLNEAIQYASHFRGLPDWGDGSETSWTITFGGGGSGGAAGEPTSEPDTRTPQQRALPQPSTTPPMWADDPTRSRRPRRRRGQPTRQGIA